MSENIVVLKNYKLTKEPGIHKRLICMTGDNRGDVYYLKGKRIILGRGEKADVKILDDQSSREHAEIININNNLIISNLSSSNGLYLNGQLIKQKKLNEKDKIIIGKTVYKFDTVNVDKMVARKPKELDHLTEEKKKKKNIKSKSLIVLMLIVAYVMFSGDEEKKVKTNTIKRDFILVDEFENMKKKKYLKKEKKYKEKLNKIMNRGIRELREQNYYRAISEFDLALLVDPQNGRSIAYKNKAKELLDNDIESYFSLGQKYEESYYLEKAIQNYCSILKLLENYPKDKRYVQSKRIIEKISNQISGDGNAYSCK